MRTITRIASVLAAMLANISIGQTNSYISNLNLSTHHSTPNNSSELSFSFIPTVQQRIESLFVPNITNIEAIIKPKLPTWNVSATNNGSKGLVILIADDHEKSIAGDYAQVYEVVRSVTRNFAIEGAVYGQRWNPRVSYGKSTNTVPSQLLQQIHTNNTFGLEDEFLCESGDAIEKNFYILEENYEKSTNKEWKAWFDGCLQNVYDAGGPKLSLTPENKNKVLRNYFALFEINSVNRTKYAVDFIDANLKAQTLAVVFGRGHCDDMQKMFTARKISYIFITNPQLEETYQKTSLNRQCFWEE